jgi:hypothetical protein
VLSKLDRPILEPRIQELPSPGTLVVPSSEFQNRPIGPLNFEVHGYQQMTKQ